MEEIIFPNKIRILRKMAGKSMQDLADELGISLSAVSKIEKGYRKVDQEQMSIISKFIGCSMSDIFISKEEDDEVILEAWKKEIDKRVNLNKDNGLKIFGAGLRLLRNEKNLTLLDIAEKSGLTLSVYHRIEIGQREIYEKELVAVARALDRDITDLLTTIYNLKKEGALDKYMSNDTSSADSIVKMTDVLRSTENVYTDEGVIKFNKVLVHSKTLDNGNIIIDDESDRRFLYPFTEKHQSSIYAVELTSDRLGLYISPGSILFIDPRKEPKGGDMAVEVLSDNGTRKEIRVFFLRENIDGSFYGFRYGPDEKIYFSNDEIKKLQKVVLISMN